jgi:GAF domain-containing protein
MGTSAPAPALPAVPDARVDRSVLRALVHLASLVTGSHDALSTIEAVAETARGLLDAASVSIESWDARTQLLTTLVNVGDLGPGEVRWPTDETYEMSSYPQAAEVLDAGRYRVNLAHLGDGVSDPAELALLESLGKASCLHAPILVEGSLWGLLYATRTAEQPVFDAYTAELSEVVVGLISPGWCRRRRGSASRTWPRRTR